MRITFVPTIAFFFLFILSTVLAFYCELNEARNSGKLLHDIRGMKTALFKQHKGSIWDLAPKAPPYCSRLLLRLSSANLPFPLFLSMLRTRKSIRLFG